MPTIRLRDKPTTEGFLAGGSALMVTILWMVYSPFHPLVIFALFLVALFCLSLNTLWLLSKEATIKEWFISQPLRYLIVGVVEVALIVAFFFSLYLLK